MCVTYLCGSYTTRVDELWGFTGARGRVVPRWRFTVSAGNRNRGKKRKRTTQYTAASSHGGRRPSERFKRESRTENENRRYRDDPTARVSTSRRDFYIKRVDETRRVCAVVLLSRLTLRARLFAHSSSRTPQTCATYTGYTLYVSVYRVFALQRRRETLQ